MRVLICGGRDFTDHGRIQAFLWALQVKRSKFSLIIHGAAPGADMLVDRYAKRHKIPVLAFPANWAAFGPAAGPIRNQQMLIEGEPNLVVAFPGGRGTANMIMQAKAAGIEVINAR